MPLCTKFITGLLILLTLACMVIILLFPGPETAKVVAITALLVTTAKSGYDIYEKELERRKKAEDAREKIIATAKYGIWDTSTSKLGVEIYNAGASPVSIASVECHCPKNGTRARLPLTNIAYMPSEIVPSKNTAKFRLDSLEIDPVTECGRLPDTDIWITIRTHEGAEFRVDGKEIARVLNAAPTSQHPPRGRRTL
jgi:hypothetical protein